MKLHALLLFIAATLRASISFGLPSRESNGVDFFVQNNLRANLTDENEGEDRMPYLDINQAMIEQTLSSIPEFPLVSVKDFGNRVIERMNVAKSGYNVNNEEFIRTALFSSDYLGSLTSQVYFPNEEHVNIAAYLVLLESTGGSIKETAKKIHVAMAFVKKRPVAERIEEGQFRTWSTILKTVNDAAEQIFDYSLNMKWKVKILDRYKSFLDRTQSNPSPGD
ncbi:hypothetical protein PsorP6_016489 [Peronosclerospora sorghi]|uniref:Uncharacterized protein n=1 Tax=Peronosclerospora sorghi TaxID=230839 RepID=A0ACC0VLX9_9STRA|nr:hypothetical protein PsorP6_016489 [Peronosclerospora sorghi]